MRTNIVIDDKLMADVMAYGDFKTKREAVEAGLMMIKRRKAYDALLAARGTLHWDDSDEAWERRRAEQTSAAAGADISEAAARVKPAAHEPAASYAEANQTAQTTRTSAAKPKAKRVKKVTAP